ncbi:arsenate reductase ArsC [Entomospira culicis]|uniref:Arsenate reductase ArsC n=1 Tax=Entomospira culicis TaxID=2719989 RepID=A0A968GGL3_9SPIO|nr:arsenate reductase ArsC [Entomospira culicis]NIZ19237.1 arsenate reductase ArsC [Entomospira culicis]NIZ69451.1 arsenate reductase ArsC [Entomospira culicis]WDI36567.1 arsenate reductase ArsC [Entomospira culicis]WDI38193.1 arsenate reductase ArsC [Entomospira culicis]
MKNKPKVAFICVHNSCRSQMAEALGKHFASDVFESYSAGTEVKPAINADAVRLMQRIYAIDMRERQYSKLIDALPQVDIVITMGCNVECPHVVAKHREDWGLADPSGEVDAIFIETIDRIERNIKDLARRIRVGEITL